MSDDILFDNIIITDDKRVAEDWAAQTWVIKHDQELAGTVSGVRCFVSLASCHSLFVFICLASCLPVGSVLLPETSGFNKNFRCRYDQVRGSEQGFVCLKEEVLEDGD